MTCEGESSFECTSCYQYAKLIINSSNRFCQCEDGYFPNPYSSSCTSNIFRITPLS